MRSRKRMLGMEFNSKLFLIFLVLLPVLITGFTLLYPFALVSGEIEPAILGADFEEKIQAQESQLKPRPGTEKKIFWANDKKNKTPVSIVYLHGWSASRQELSPTVEKVASEMKANLFMTRLTGHGLDGEALGRVTTENLLQDAEDALAVGKKLGEKVILIGGSTGASLALYLATKYNTETSAPLAAAVLISPNFRPHRTEALLLRGPFGPLFGRLVIGPYYEFAPKGEEQKKYWTTRYPTRALTEMMNLVDGIRRRNLSIVKIPTLLLYTESDETISVSLAKEKFEELGSARKNIVMIPSPSHVLAGSIMSPKTTDQVIDEIVKFLN